jgi:hypothetical protein
VSGAGYTAQSLCLICANAELTGQCGYFVALRAQDVSSQELSQTELSAASHAVANLGPWPWPQRVVSNMIDCLWNFSTSQSLPLSGK